MILLGAFPGFVDAAKAANDYFDSCIDVNYFL
jgi:hypothetical protein